jgi:hypothetical protein
MPFAAADCTPRCFLSDTQRKQSLAASGGPPASASRRHLLLGTRLRPTQCAFRPAVDAGTLWWRLDAPASARVDVPCFGTSICCVFCRFETDLPL